MPSHLRDDGDDARIAVVGAIHHSAAAESSLHEAIAALGVQVQEGFTEVNRLIADLQLAPSSKQRGFALHAERSQLEPAPSSCCSEAEHPGQTTSFNSKDDELSIDAIRFMHSGSKKWSQGIRIRKELVLASEDENITKLRNYAVSALAPKCFSTAPGSSLESAAFRVIHPASKYRVAFDASCMVMICFQVFYLPFALVWQEEVDVVDRYILLGTTIFWLTDMLLHFVTGFYNTAGEVEMRFRVVVKNYFQTWFPADALCVSLDILNLASEFALTQLSNTTATRALHIVKMQRVLRAFVIFRMMRASKVIYEYMESRTTTAFTVVLRTIQFAVLILWTAHVVACVWFAIGRYAPVGTHESHWIDSPHAGEFGEFSIADLDVWYQFASSYHWALAQITLGGLDINPKNSWERLLAILCNLFGLFFGGVVVSILSSTMIGLREMNITRVTTMRTLREFLLQHGIRLSIRLRVVRQAQERMMQRGRAVCEKDVSALSLLSSSLLRDLRHNLYSGFVVQHPLLHCWQLLQTDSIKYFCSEGLAMTVLLPDDELFATGMHAKGAYLTIEGSVRYQQTAKEGFADQEVLEEQPPGCWISEAAWWCNWFHIGTATALRPSTLLSLPAEAVIITMHRDPVICAISIEYGIRFHRYILEEESNVSDTNMQYVDFNGVFCNLPREVHVILGMAALQRIEGTPQRWRLDRTGNLKRLEQEIREGESLLLLDNHGILRRRVAITTMKLSKQDEDGSIAFLTQLAVYEKSSWKRDLRPLGVKQRSGETHHQAFQRILDTNFGVCGWDFQPSEWNRATENQDSAHFGVGTEYIKMTGVVQFTEQMEADLQALALPLLLRAGVSPSSRSTAPAWPSLMRATSTTWSRNASPDDLLNSILRTTEAVYILGGESKGLYIWMTSHTFDRLQRQESIATRLVRQLVDACQFPEDLLLFDVVGSFESEASAEGDPSPQEQEEGQPGQNPLPQSEGSAVRCEQKMQSEGSALSHDPKAESERSASRQNRRADIELWPSSLSTRSGKEAREMLIDMDSLIAKAHVTPAQQASQS